MSNAPIMRVEIDTTLQFADLAKDEERRFLAEGQKAVRKAVNRLRNRVRANLRGVGRGRQYVIDGKAHRASLPGEDPAKFSGKLGRGMRTAVKIRRKDGAIVGTVHPSREDWLRAHGLEFGATVGNWVLAPRSFLRRAMIQEERGIASDLAESVRD